MSTDGDHRIHSFDGPDGKNYNGLTKREYFAAMAMQGLCANGWFMEQNIKCAEAGGEQIHVVDMAVDIADGLIKSLNKEQK